MCKLFVVEYHDQVLELWREQKFQSKQVLHIDFHCDLRGLLIDRRRQQAYRIWDRFSDVDEGNYLTHAVLEGIIDRIRWVHDEPGGRRDDIKSVKYESDATAIWHRCLLGLTRSKGVPIQYAAMLYDHWNRVEVAELLDIDWDFFASKEYPFNSIEQRVERFLSRDFANKPEQIYVCYSPGYSHSTRELFQEFVGKLAARFDAEVVNVANDAAHSPTKTVPGKPNLDRLIQPARHLYHQVGLALRRRGIY